MAVVTRWFGGTLLGVGGLVRAYSDAVALALDEAGVLRRERRELVEVDAGHAEAGRLEHELRSRGLVVRDASYGAVVTLTLAVPAGLSAVAARHPGRAHRGRAARRGRVGHGLGRPAGVRAATGRDGGQPAGCGGSTEVWLGSSFCGTRPTGQVIPLGPWLQ